ncbi:hypothetical protein VTO73DRAFT_9692 [Trametes versicolor]
MASDNAAQLEYHKMQLVGSLNALAHNMRECAAIADAFVHTLNYGSNPQPFPPLGANGQFPMTMVPMPVAHDDGKKRKARGDDNEAKKRAKKIKDPNAPKRPASSYILFQNDVRSELRKKNPEMRNNELLSHIAKLWSEMPQEQKEAYEARNRSEKDRWLAEKAVYESTGKAGEPSGIPMQIAPVPIVAPIKTPVPPPVAATPSSSDETSGEDDSEDDSSSDVDESAIPPPKKSKREVAVAPAKDEATPKKEKKHKKAKA